MDETIAMDLTLKVLATRVATSSTMSPPSSPQRSDLYTDTLVTYISLVQQAPVVLLQLPSHRESDESAWRPTGRKHPGWANFGTMGDYMAG